MAKKTLQEFFDLRVVKSDGCWVWQKGKATTYGICRRQRAHRVSYELHVGPIPNGLFVLHRCDNPPCVNPKHLFVGTHIQNMDDAILKGRLRSDGNAKVTPEQAAEIIRLVKARQTTKTAIGARFGIGPTSVTLIMRRAARKLPHAKTVRLASAVW